MPDDNDDKSSAARELGRRRMAKLTPEERSALAKKAARARWPVPPPKPVT